MSRVYNFSAGPAVLPEEVLKEAADEMLDYRGSGMSVMEMSHRSKVYDNIIKEAEQDLRDLMNIPDNYKVLFLQGGASQQFAMIPMNLMKNRKAGYIVTGQWAKKAYQEAQIYGEAVKLASSEDKTFSYIPDCSDLDIPEDLDYVYICENNTIYGTKYKKLPNTKGHTLVADAEKRLAAIKEYTELGSGFKIAMRDLEIRGAGSLLGERQHGHMEAVGYDLYCKMLNEAVKEAKGIAVEESFDTSIDIVIDAYIPMGYIPNELQKLDIYKRIADIETQEETEEMTEELIDRFGDPPKSVENLLYIAKIKSMAHRLYFTEVAQKGESVRFTLYEKARIDVAKIPELVAAYGQKVTFTADPKNPYFTYHLKKNSRDKNVDIKSVVEQFLSDAGGLLTEREAPKEG